MNKALWEKAMAEFATSWTAMAASSSPAILVTSSTPLVQDRRPNNANATITLKATMVACQAS